jgi:hypothetical protein
MYINRADRKQIRARVKPIDLGHTPAQPDAAGGGEGGALPSLSRDVSLAEAGGLKESDTDLRRKRQSRLRTRSTRMRLLP